MTPGNPKELGADLWSAPVSAQPADDLYAGPVPGPAPLVPAELLPARRALDKAARDTGCSRPAGRNHGRNQGGPRRSIVSLVVAAAVLLGLGFAAQRLDPSDGGSGDSSGAISTQNPAPSRSPSPASAPDGGTATVVSGGPSYCPMEADSAGLECFFIG